MAVVLHHSKASAAGKLVLLGIANHQSDGGAWPALATLAKYANVSERRVRQVLRELEEAGELETRLQWGGDGQYKTNLYWVRVACPANCDGTTAHRSQGGNNQHQGGNNQQSGGKYSAIRGEASFPQTIKEPLENHIPSNSKHFEEFWEVYPRRVGRQDSMRAFNSLAPQERIRALAGAKRLAADPNLPEKQFVPHPATWLRREGWSDEPYPPRPRTQEELLEEARRKDRAGKDREKMARAHEKDWAYEPPPQCEHNKPIHKCRICTKRLAEEGEK